MSNEEIPIVRLQKLSLRLDRSVENKKWDRSIKLATKIGKLVPKALNPSTCKTNTPHLEGLYAIGTSRYEQAPDEAKRAINKMNRIIRTARRTIK